MGAPGIPPFLLIFSYVIGGCVAVGLALCILRIKRLWWRIGGLCLLVVAGVGYVVNVQRLDHACLQGSYANAAAPLDASRMLFFLQGDPARLVALEARTGTIQWQQPLSVSVDSSSFLVQNQVVYAPWSGEDDRQFGLRAYRVSDGNVLWQADVPNPDGELIGESEVPLQIADGLIYTLAYRRYTPVVYAFHESNGSAAWNLPLDHSSQAYHSQSRPLAAGDGLLFVSTMILGQPNTSAYRAQDGSLAWQAPLSSQRPFYAAGILYLQDATGLSALRASDGTILWRQPLPSVYPLTLSSAGQQLYVEAAPPGAGRYFLYALQAQAGTVLWSYPASPSPGYDAAVQANGVVYYPSVTDLLALDAHDGRLLRRYAINSNAGFSAPVVLGQVVLVQSHLIYPHEGYQCPGDHEPTDALFAMHVSDGAIYWRYPISLAGWEVVADG